jgi:imidazolonepropionase-like amidohydrolase
MVFDGTRAGVGTVVLQGSQIAEVVFGEATPVATVMPGLFDMHVHTGGDGAPYAYFSEQDHTEAGLKARLRAGVTSYLDLGSSKRRIFELRARLRDGRMLGPNLFAAGPLLTPHGGHPCLEGDPPSDFCAFVDTPADVTAELDALMPGEPDVVMVVI